MSDMVQFWTVALSEAYHVTLKLSALRNINRPRNIQLPLENPTGSQVSKE